MNGFAGMRISGLILAEPEATASSRRGFSVFQSDRLELHELVRRLPEVTAVMPGAVGPDLLFGCSTGILVFPGLYSRESDEERKRPMLKRSCDVVLAAIGLVLLSPLFLISAVLIKLESPGPVLFRQPRVGRGFRTFIVFKFRTMRVAESRGYELTCGNRGYELTCGNDERITRFGALLRRTKFDETPQLWNILRGEMSIVGPRPQTPALVESMRDHYAAVLCARPGMTDLASIRFRGGGRSGQGRRPA